MEGLPLYEAVFSIAVASNPMGDKGIRNIQVIACSCVTLKSGDESFLIDIWEWPRPTSSTCLY